MRVSFEIKCCPYKGVYHHWYFVPNGFRDPTHSQKVVESKMKELLDKGHHSVVLMKVHRKALKMSQPRKDSSAICRKRFGMPCNFDHDHV